MSSKSAHIVIIGGSYSGLTTTTKVLAAIPTAKVTLVSTSEYYYFNLGAPRLLARPTEITAEQVAHPIADIFKKHPAIRFEFVHGTVTDLDVTKKAITTDSSAAPVIDYDYLVIASGSHTLSTIAKQRIPVKQPITDDLKQSIQEAQKYIANAKSIVIGGGGPVAVELGSEIAEAYPTKKVTIVSGSDRLLSTIKPSAGHTAEVQLSRLGVKIVHKLKVQDTDHDEVKGQYNISLSDGSKLQADLYVAAVGLYPNNNFIPQTLLDEGGWVKVDNHLRVNGVSAVYALGDITNLPGRMAINAKAQSTIVATNLAVDINHTGSLKAYKGGKTGMIVPIGKTGGTGQLGPFVPWSWMVSKIKGQTYFIPTAVSFVS